MQPPVHSTQSLTVSLRREHKPGEQSGRVAVREEDLDNDAWCDSCDRREEKEDNSCMEKGHGFCFFGEFLCILRQFVCGFLFLGSLVFGFTCFWVHLFLGSLVFGFTCFWNRFEAHDFLKDVSRATG